MKLDFPAKYLNDCKISLLYSGPNITTIYLAKVNDGPLEYFLTFNI